MAEFRVRRHVAAEGRLPMICMLCGAPATTRKNKRMIYKPSWILMLILLGVLPYFIVSFALEKRALLVAPLCERHQGHWRTRNLVLWGIFLSACVLAGAALLAGKQFGGFLCMGACCIGLVWLVTAAVLYETSLHATEITTEGMTLTGVSLHFLDALRTVQPPPQVKLEEQRYFQSSPRSDAPGPADEFYDPSGPRA
jgi:hypothetical protein